MTAYWLNIAGLIFGIVGVVVLFVWGPPQPLFTETTLLGVDPGTFPKKDAARRAKKHRHEIGSRVGLALVLVGFVLQLAAAILQRPKSAEAAAATAFHVDGAC